MVSIAFKTGWSLEYVFELELTVIWDIIDINNPDSKPTFDPEENKKEVTRVKKRYYESQKRAREREKKAREK